MRQPGRWMKAPDPFIIEYIAESGPSSPAELVDDERGGLPFSRGYVNMRCQELEENGFLVNLGNGMYQLTDRGTSWLDGDFDAAILDDGDRGNVTA